MLTFEDANRRWRYEPETGHFYWLDAYKKSKIGGRAGAFSGKYLRLHFEGVDYPASRVAWLLMTGSWPKDQIDHINRDKRDDRWANLREASVAENCYNRKRKKPNKSGVKGVHVDDRCPNSFVVIIGVNGKRIRLGSFRDINEARMVYESAVKKYHGEFAAS